MMSTPVAEKAGHPSLLTGDPFGLAFETTTRRFLLFFFGNKNLHYTGQQVLNVVHLPFYERYKSNLEQDLWLYFLNQRSDQFVM